MILLSNIILALAKIIELADGLLTVYKYVLIASALVSWVSPDPYNPIVNFLYKVTEPLLKRIRKVMPDTGAVDLSPLVAFALIYVVQIVVLNTMYDYLITFSMNIRLKG
jgi:YggT family protein